MRRKMQISKIGLKLIKAYEGFRPVDRYLVNGHHVVGYGHIIEGDDSLTLTRAEAEDLLLSDLEPYEDMVNETVHAPLTQSQFDALVSLAFNIGPRAFTQSDTLRALNNGRPLDAASSFDIWRKSMIDGKIYVVDALMRRRTAEKALFLSTDGKKTLPASRADLPPVRDEIVALLTTEDALPVLSNDPRNGLVARVPYERGAITEVAFDEADDEDAASYVTVDAPQPKITQDENPLTYARRREDGPSGILELSEIYEDGVPPMRNRNIDDDLVDSTYEVEDYGYENAEVEVGDIETPSEELPLEALPLEELDETNPSLIANTAKQISDRLDALIDDVASDEGASNPENWPEAMIKADNLSSELIGADLEGGIDTESNVPSVDSDIVIDNLVEDDAFRERTDSAAKYIKIDPSERYDSDKGGIGYFIPLLIGMCLIGASAGAILGNPTAILGEWGPLLSFTGLLIGITMTIVTVYYALKTKISI